MGLRFLNERFIAESLIKNRRGADTYFGQMTSHPELITEQVITSGLLYKRGSQEKISLRRLDFFLLHSPLDRARSVLTRRAMSSVAGYYTPAVWISSTSGFHRLFATKPVSSETSKAEQWSSGDHGSIWDSWPIAFSGYPRGPRVD
jgi:hypothetical protein